MVSEPCSKILYIEGKKSQKQAKQGEPHRKWGRKDVGASVDKDTVRIQHKELLSRVNSGSQRLKYQPNSMHVGDLGPLYIGNNYAAMQTPSTMETLSYLCKNPKAGAGAGAGSVYMACLWIPFP